jgi:hypothetical protein
VTEDLGPSWLTGTPDGAVVARRDVHLCTVAEVEPGVFFTARVPGRRARRPFDWALIPDGDVPVVKPGAKFWLVTERIQSRGYSRPEQRSALAFRRPGATTPQQAFTIRRESTHA